MSSRDHVPLGCRFLICACAFSSGDSYSSTQFYIEGGYPSASDPIGQPDLPGSTTSGGLNWVGVVTSELNTSLVLTYDWAYYGADTSNAIINTVSQWGRGRIVMSSAGLLKVPIPHTGSYHRFHSTSSRIRRVPRPRPLASTLDGNKHSSSSLVRHQRRGRVLLGVLPVPYVSNRPSHGNILRAPLEPIR